MSVTFDKAIRWSPYLSAFLFGAIYPLGLAPLSWWPSLVLSISGLVVILLSATKRSTFWLCYWYGFGFFLVGASWVHVSINTFGNAPLPLSVLLTLLFVGFLALFKGLIGIAISLVERRANRLFAVCTLPGFWLASDYLQAYSMTGFPWLYSGYGLVDSPFKGLLAWVGVFGASFWLVSVALCIGIATVMIVNSTSRQTQVKRSQPRPSEASTKPRRKYVACYSVILVSLLLAGLSATIYPLSEQKMTDLSVGIVQPNIAQEQKWRKDKLIEFLTLYREMSLPLWGVDLVIWPEAAIPELKHRVEDYIASVEQDAVKNGSNWIFGVPRLDFDKREIKASLIARGETRWQYDKQHLVPFGEFVPFEQYLRGLIEFFNLPMSGMAAGDEGQRALTTDKAIYIPAICYEIAYQRLIKKLLGSGESSSFTAIVTVSNDAWFGRSWGPWQHFQIARARAVEFGVPVFRATNNGISAVISATGNVLQSVPQFERDTLLWRGELYNLSTPFREYGSTLIFIFVTLSQIPLIIFSLVFEKSEK